MAIKKISLNGMEENESIQAQHFVEKIVSKKHFTVHNEKIVLALINHPKFRNGFNEPEPINKIA